jgi:hypothetical protein
MMDDQQDHRLDQKDHDVNDDTSGTRSPSSEVC